MTLSELTEAFRIRADDRAQPYLWSDDEVALYINESEREACVRARLIRDEIEIDLSAGESVYALPAPVLEVRRAALSDGTVLRASSIEALDTAWPDWAAATGAPQFVVDTGNGDITVVPVPTAADTLKLVVFRLPAADMASDSDTPEIHTRYHMHLLDWALRLAYLKHDADAFDQGAADRHGAMFERSFGYNHTANVQRKHRDKRVPAVKSEW